MTPQAIVSVQSHVAYGHVGNASAVFCLQRLGFEVWPVMTVQFSNHTGYGTWTGDVFTPDHIGRLMTGMDERGAFASAAALLSGYMGDAGLGETILATRDRIKAHNPDALYLCDPVMGDVGRGIFVRPEIVPFMKAKAVPAADAITPNQFELELLTGVSVHSLEDAVAGARKALDLGPSVVLVTSLRHEHTPEDRIEMLAVTRGGAWVAGTPMLPLTPPPNGAGDAVSALFLGHLMRHESVTEALAKTTAGIYAIIEATWQAGTRELQLIAAQERFAAPASVEVVKVS